ncbi:MAG: hypothetical protein HKN39_08225 [Flavobacteriales bacterium]|nr:hypothetical protein [Flavobacteriales bacterium]
MSSCEKNELAGVDEPVSFERAFGGDDLDDPGDGEDGNASGGDDITDDEDDDEDDEDEITDDEDDDEDDTSRSVLTRPNDRR